MRTLSGIQPTGNLHLGNYLGAIKNWVKMQDEGEALFFLADLHAITVYNDPAELSANTREMAAALIAAGIDPEKAILFNQARLTRTVDIDLARPEHRPRQTLARRRQCIGDQRQQQRQKHQNKTARSCKNTRRFRLWHQR